MNAFEAVLFDLGSTLIFFDGAWPEVLPRLNQALLLALQDSGLALAGSDFIERYQQRIQTYYAERDTEFFEYTTSTAVRTTLVELGYTSTPENTIRKAIAAMYAVSQSHWQVEADALPTLKALRERGYRLGIISNAADDQDVQALVDKAGIRPFFEVILTSAAEGIRKPNPHIFHTALNALGGIPPKHAAMVGDTLGADILGARNAGLYGIWISRRADTAANRAHQDTILPDRTVDTLDELLKIFP